MQTQGKIDLLLVDDEEDFRRTIAKRLRRRGMSPEEAGNGEECLTMIDEHPMDVVVLDVKMPGMSGIEILRRIKEKHPGTEVLLLTGYATTHDGVEGIKAGAFDYLSKPVELEQLIGKIQQAYDKIQREKEKIREADYRTRIEQQMIATERLASLGTLAAGVAHEINNPLAIIQEAVGWMQLLLQKSELEDLPRKADFDLALTKIKNGIERARRITHQLLGFVRKTDSHFSEIDLTDLIHEAIEMVKTEAGDRHIELISDSDEERVTIFSDPYQLRQVLINLLTNAIQATLDAGEIKIHIVDADDNVSFSIVDNGRGVPKENMEKIFEPFFSTKAPGQGTGLGLFVTRGILGKLEGRIELESRLGHGAEFRVILPKIFKMQTGRESDDRRDWTKLIKDIH